MENGHLTYYRQINFLYMHSAYTMYKKTNNNYKSIMKPAR